MSTDTEGYDILVFSDDPVLSRTVIAEACRCGLAAEAALSSESLENAKVCVVDLDSHSAELPLISSRCKPCKSIIGIGYNTHIKEVSDTSKSADASGLYGYCDLVLKRPFLLAKLGQALKASVSAANSFEASAPSLPILDRSSLSVMYCGKSIPLSPNECLILDLLLSKSGTAVSRDEIADLIGDSSSNKADVYVCYLRRKLEGASGVRLIKAVRNVGYTIE